MANSYVLSPNMSLPVPIVGVDLGPDWASNLNGCMAILDPHDHSAGFGVPITPSGMNISSDLPFRSNNAIALRSVRFTPTAIPATAPDLGCIYVNGVDLYYNDINGNQIPLTTSGHIAGSVGSISGLVSPATASYASSTFVFRSAANTSSFIDSSSITIRPMIAAAPGITIAAPGSLPGNYTLTLPVSLPVAQSITTIDPSGNVATPVAFPIPTAGIAAQAIAQSNLALRTTGSSTATNGGVATGVGTAATAFASGATAVSGCSITITTTGRPVFIAVVPSQGTSAGSVLIQNSGGGAGSFLGSVDVLRAGSKIASSSYQYLPPISGATNIQLPLPGFIVLDPIGAGTYVYSVQVTGSVISNANASINNPTLIAYEI